MIKNIDFIFIEYSYTYYFSPLITNSCLKTVSMTANQSGACVLENPPSSQSVNCMAETFSLSLSLTGNTTGLKAAMSQQTWLTINSVSATSISFTKLANTSSTSRTMPISITNSCGKSVSFVLTQTGCSADQSRITNMTAAAGSATISVSASAGIKEVMRQASDGWLTVDSYNQANAKISWTANKTSIQRHATIIVYGNCGCNSMVEYIQPIA